jgi:enamine deaminase RidA (YjgF/YER057c/UK114 family)
MNPETIAPPQGAYSHAVEIPAGSNVLHVSGQVGVAPDGTVPSDFRGQAENAWFNLARILEHNGMGMADVVKVSQFLTRAEDMPAYREVRGKYLGDRQPASTLLIVAGLASPEFLVEVEIVAAKS